MDDTTINLYDSDTDDDDDDDMEGIRLKLKKESERKRRANVANAGGGAATAAAAESKADDDDLDLFSLDDSDDDDGDDSDEEVRKVIMEEKGGQQKPKKKQLQQVRRDSIGSTTSSSSSGSSSASSSTSSDDDSDDDDDDDDATDTKTNVTPATTTTTDRNQQQQKRNDNHHSSDSDDSFADYGNKCKSTVDRGSATAPPPPSSTPATTTRSTTTTTTATTKGGLGQQQQSSFDDEFDDSFLEDEDVLREMDRKIQAKLAATAAEKQQLQQQTQTQTQTQHHMQHHMQKPGETSSEPRRDSSSGRSSSSSRSSHEKTNYNPARHQQGRQLPTQRNEESVTSENNNPSSRRKIDGDGGGNNNNNNNNNGRSIISSSISTATTTMTASLLSDNNPNQQNYKKDKEDDGVGDGNDPSRNSYNYSNNNNIHASKQQQQKQPFIVTQSQQQSQQPSYSYDDDNNRTTTTTKPPGQLDPGTHRPPQQQWQMSDTTTTTTNDQQPSSSTTTAATLLLSSTSSSNFSRNDRHQPTNRNNNNNDDNTVAPAGIIPSPPPVPPTRENFTNRNNENNNNNNDRVQQQYDGDSDDDTAIFSQEINNDNNSTSTTKPNNNGSRAEIDPMYYVPQEHRSRPEPLVHYFSTSNRPKHQRKRIPVSQIFPNPIDKLWNNKFGSFNHLQSEIANVLAYSDDNVVVSAPTGAGKTAVFEMAMARFFTNDLQQGNHQCREGAGLQQQQQQHLPQVSMHRKIVYIAPSKALCEERCADWSTRLAAMNLGLRVAMVTGDGDPSEAFRDLTSSHLVVTTPEKFDSLTRRWTENFCLFASFKLYLIDEIHLLADESRGCCLESVLCRVKSIQRAASQIRFHEMDIEVSSYPGTTPEAISSVIRTVAVSATLPNIADIAAFLEANEAHTFDASYRPVPLTTHVIGQGFVGDKSNSQFRFWSGLNRNVPELVLRFSNKRPTIIFCHSKNDTEKLADLLANANGVSLQHNDNSNNEIASQTRLTKLQRVLYRGIAFHHAGLDVDDRRLVETSFSRGKIRALCATSTLAMGVNLPAHLVIVKGTKAWRGGGNGYQDIEQASLLQMIGRAGRPGYDTSGMAVIMTDNKSKATFQKLASSGLEPAMSQLLLKLDEIINAEISQRVITSTETAVNWIKGSLYYMQLRKDPSSHGVHTPSPHSVDAHLIRICNESIYRLREIGALEKGEGTLQPLAASHIMSHNLVEYQAMQLIVQLPFDASLGQVLKSLSAVEGMHRPVRRSEKKCLNETHKDIKYKLEGPPSKVRVQDPTQKAFVLLQASIGQIFLEDYTLRQEMNSMVEYASRMLSAIEEYSLQGSKHGHVALQSLRLRRSLATSLWGRNDGVLNQLLGIGTKTTAILKLHGITTFEDVIASNDEMIEKAAQRTPPFGSNLRTVVSKILRGTFKLAAHLEYAAGSTTPCSLVCRLEPRNDIPRLYDGSSTTSSAPTVTYTLIAYTNKNKPGGRLFYKRDISSPETFKIDTPPKFGKITAVLLASLVGLDEKVELRGNEEMEDPPSTARPAVSKKAKAASTTNAAPRKVRNFQQSRVEQFTVPKRSKGAKSSTGRTTTGTASALKPPPERANNNVTPSPKPLPATTASQNNNVNQTAKASASSKRPHEAMSRPQRNLPPRPHHHAPAIEPERRPRRHCNEEREAAAVKRKVDQARIQSISENENDRSGTLTLPNSVVGRTSQGFFQGRSSSSQFPSTTQQISPKPATWRQAKREQQKSQQKAFRRKKDNPFLQFKHDPNNSESQLDFLASQPTENSPQNSIIPAEGLRLLDAAYKSAPRHNNSLLGSSMSQHPASRMRPSGRRAIATSGRPSGPDLLALKAQECNEQSQAWYSSGWDNFGQDSYAPPPPPPPPQRNTSPYYSEPAMNTYHHGATEASLYGGTTATAYGNTTAYSSRYFNTQPAPSYSQEMGQNKQVYHQQPSNGMDVQSHLSYGMDTSSFAGDASFNGEMSLMTQSATSWPPEHQEVALHQSQARTNNNQQCNTDGMDDSEMVNDAFFW